MIKHCNILRDTMKTLEKEREECYTTLCMFAPMTRNRRGEKNEKEQCD